MPLTVKEVKNAKPGRLSDGGGLYLLTKPSGTRSWVLRVQLNGERKDYGIGGFTAEPIPADVALEKRKLLTLTEAREKARRGRLLAKAGINPVAAWKSEDLVVPTFKVAAKEYHLHIQKTWKNGKHRAQWLSTLETYAFPVIGSMLVSEIEAHDIQRVLNPIWLSKSETARRVRQRILAVLDYAHGKSWREAEAPARALDELLKGLKQPRGGNFAAMPWADLPAFMAELRGGPPSVGKWALQFLILTAARTIEVRKAKWEQIDWEAREWAVPPANMKKDKPHLVPLTPEAMAVLEAVKAVHGCKPSAFIFPGLKGMMSDATMSKALSVAGGGEYTVHGMRSSFTDWGADTGQPDAWVDKALAHKLPDKVDAAYRRTTYFNQRRDKLMPAWSAFVMNEKSNVASITERRSA